MTDKVQKIREEVVRMHNLLPIMDGDNISVNYADRICTTLEMYIDSMQEEPKFKIGDRIKPIDSCLGSPRTILEVCDGWYVTNTGTLDFEFEDNWELVEKLAGLDKDKLMGMLEESLSKETKESWNKFLQEEPVNKVDVDAAMSEVEAKAKTFTVSHEGESSDGILAQMRGEEPVSEDLEEASKEWLKPQLDKSYANYGEAKMMELTHFDGYAMLDAVEFGAKWQEQQLEKNRLARCDAQTEEEAEREQEFVMQHIKKYHCQPTFSDAIEWGINRQREQIMKNATEAACDAYCTVCDTQECGGCAECSWVIKFRRQFIKEINKIKED